MFGDSPMFWKRTMHPSSGLKSTPSKNHHDLAVTSAPLKYWAFSKLYFIKTPKTILFILLFTLLMEFIKDI
jgi:hypothetical protein